MVRTGGFLSPALAWGGLELGEFCLLSMTWGGQYGGFLSPPLAWGGLALGGNLLFIIIIIIIIFIFFYFYLFFLFALGDQGWSVRGAS